MFLIKEFRVSYSCEYKLVVRQNQDMSCERSPGRLPPPYLPVELGDGAEQAAHLHLALSQFRGLRRLCPPGGPRLGALLCARHGPQGPHSEPAGRSAAGTNMEESLIDMIDMIDISILLI